jgi:hypothetical protein
VGASQLTRKMLKSACTSKRLLVNGRNLRDTRPLRTVSRNVTVQLSRSVVAVLLQRPIHAQTSALGPFQASIPSLALPPARARYPYPLFTSPLPHLLETSKKAPEYRSCQGAAMRASPGLLSTSTWVNDSNSQRLDHPRQRRRQGFLILF